MTYEELYPHIQDLVPVEHQENIIDADNVYSQDTLEVSINNEEYEILTPNNTWCSFKGIKKITRPDYIILTLENGEQIKGSPWHRLLVNKNTRKYEYLGLMKAGVSYIDFHGKLLLVTNKEHITEEVELFDILDVDNEENNFMLGEDSQLVSHNCAAIDARRKEAMEEIWSAAGITLTKSKGSCFVISTPKGAAGWYYDQYTNAEKNGWNVISAHWSEHPEYSRGMYQWIRDETNKKDGGHIKRFNDLWPTVEHIDDLKKYGKPSTYNYIKDGKLRSPWYDVESAKLTPSKVACELDCSFASSGTEVLTIQVRAAMTAYAALYKQLEMKIKSGYWKDYHQFKAYTAGRKYLLAADAATGDGADSSAFVIVDYTDIDSIEVVATFKSSEIDPYTFANMIEIVAKGFGWCEVVIEHQIGITSLLHLKNTLKYPNLYYHILKSRNTDLKDKNAKKTKLGLWQDDETRSLGGDELETLLSTIISSPFKKQHMLKIPCARLVKEFQTWIWRKGRRDHAPSAHDDLIMSLQMAIFVIKYAKPKSQGAMNVATKVRQEASSVSSSLPQDAIRTKKMDMSKSNTTGTRIATGKKVTSSRKAMLDFN